jgi:PadR family transcriptional regulator AphA
MSVDHIILGLLRRPMSGYDIKYHFDHMINHFWAAEQSQIYRSLKTLEREGFLTCAVEPSEKGPTRKVYSVTPAGRAHLTQWLQAEPLFNDVRNAHVAQLCFMGQLNDPQQSLAFIRRLKEKQTETLAALKAVDQTARQSNPQYPDELPWEDYHFALTLNLGITMVQAGLDWYEQVIKNITTRLERQENAP